MNFIEAVTSFYTRYGDYKTRSSRSEFWWVALYIGILMCFFMTPFLFHLFADILHDPEEVSRLSQNPLVIYKRMFGHWTGILYLVFALIHFVPNITLMLRRFHDKNLSGWWYLPLFITNWIPGISSFSAVCLLIFMCFRGTDGPNRFGEDPLG